MYIETSMQDRRITAVDTNGLSQVVVSDNTSICNKMSTWSQLQRITLLAPFVPALGAYPQYVVAQIQP